MMKLYKFNGNRLIDTHDGNVAFIAINSDDHLNHHPNLPNWEELSFDEFNDNITDYQCFYNIKFIAGSKDEEFVAFSSNVNHDRLSIAIDFAPHSAGFIYKCGTTYGMSETLRLKSTGKVYPEYKSIYR